MRSKRFEVLSERAVNKDGFIGEWKEEGLIAMDSPLDPKPSLVIKDGKIIEIGRASCRERVLRLV